MDRSTTSEIETAQLVYPTIGIPSPAGNGIVDDRCPDKDENDAREHATTLSYSADGESRSDGSEHTLENCEEKIGNIAALLSQNTLETEVIEVTDEFVGGLGEGKRITPEEPL